MSREVSLATDAEDTFAIPAYVAAISKQSLQLPFLARGAARDLIANIADRRLVTCFMVRCALTEILQWPMNLTRRALQLLT